MYSPEAVRELILAALPDADVKIVSDDGVHFAGRIVSEDFEGKPPVKRQMMVYAALGELMGNEIHALTMKTWTPDEFASVS
ncbi:BolA/IbaG family iron-sulfur metabolism protein [uncultured Salinisphaera sp.]|uniref:BolA family protein n=1 Tax=uncultured Salinisphaera sp. TaxID=359372 RepID=UPI0032B11165|tara:strand:+ start:1314 stop:1556 length:243 start_codon:yes stop_codon:yes gene_type:complete